MRSGWIVFLLLFALQSGAQQEASLPKGVKSVTRLHYSNAGNDSMVLVRMNQTLYDRKGNKTMCIDSDTTFYTYDKRGNKTMEIAHDTIVYKYDRSGREIERGVIREGVYTRWDTSEYDRRGRLVYRIYGKGEEESVFSYAKDGRITSVEHARGEDGSEWWSTQVVDEKGELMKYVECSRENDTARIERHVYDSVVVRKVGDSIYSEHYSFGFLDAVSVYNAQGTMTRCEWINTDDDSRDSCITYYRLDKNGRWTMSLTYKVDRRTGALSVPVLHTFVYDSQKRLLNRDGAQGESWTYNKAGQLTEHSSGDDRTLYSYNSTGQCIEVRRYRKGRLLDCTVTRIEFYPAGR